MPIRTESELSGFGLRRRDVRECRLLEHAADLRAQLEPDVPQPLGRALVLELVRSHPAHGGDRSLELADDLGDRDLLRGARELVATLGAALARNEPTTAELRKDALEKLRRDVLSRGELLGRRQPGR